MVNIFFEKRSIKEYLQMMKILTLRKKIRLNFGLVTDICLELYSTTMKFSYPRNNLNEKQALLAN